MAGAELKTLVVSDLVESTRLVSRLGDKAAAELNRRHDALARELLRERGGREIDKTDGFLLLFDRPIDAVRYAVAYHEALRQLSTEAGIEVRARVGIHLGEVYLWQNAPEAVARGAKPLEIEGLAKPLTARLASLAAGGQTLITRGAYDLARRGAAELGQSHALQWQSHGRYTLDGVEGSIEVLEVGAVGAAPLTKPVDASKARAAAEARPGILVLPFTNLSPGSENDYIGEGLTDELISHLSGIQGLRVISRTSAQMLKGTKKDARTLGAEMRVSYILEGSVRVAGRSLRVNANLASCSYDELVWTRRVRGTLEDLLDLEEDLVREVLAACKAEITPQEEERLGERRIPDAEAYQYYLRAKQQIYTFTGEALQQALVYLEKGKAILGEDNVTLLAAEGYAQWQYFNIGISSDVAHLQKARECARKILEIDPHSAAGHRLMGLVEILEKGDSEAIIRHLGKALEEDPDDTDTLFWLSLMCGFVGHSAAGYGLVERLLEIDPLVALHRMLPGYLAMLEGDFENGRIAFSKSHEMEPDNPMITLSMGQYDAMAGRTEEALAVFDGLTVAEAGFFGAVGQLFAHALRGEREAVLSGLDESVREAAQMDQQYSWLLAQCLALVGEGEAAVDWLENAFRRGFYNFPLLSQGDPLLETARESSRFRPLVREVYQRWTRVKVPAYS